MKSTYCLGGIAILWVLVCAGFALSQPPGVKRMPPEALAQPSAPQNGIAVIQPASGSAVKGVVRFKDEGKGVRIAADLEGLTPNAEHGFHIHEYGDCSAPDATSAGSHYDPQATKHHGKPEDTMKHGGDMGNVKAGADGKVHFELLMQGVSLAGPQAPILGHAVIVHAKPDDFSQPVGNAGGRIGCGVIGIAK